MRLEEVQKELKLSEKNSLVCAAACLFLPTFTECYGCGDAAISDQSLPSNSGGYISRACNHSIDSDFHIL